MGSTLLMRNGSMMVTIGKNLEREVAKNKITAEAKAALWAAFIPSPIAASSPIAICH
jgi:hypothetical protein